MSERKRTLETTPDRCGQLGGGKLIVRVAAVAIKNKMWYPTNIHNPKGRY